jgi:hypothetical protein
MMYVNFCVIITDLEACLDLVVVVVVVVIMTIMFMIVEECLGCTC